MRTCASPCIGAFAGFLLLLAGVCAARAERLPITSYTPADGLAHSYVKNIIADSRGFIWFCTRRGLSRFDGERFVSYGVREGLPVLSVNDLLESVSGAYWVSTNGGGMCRLDTASGPTPSRGRASSFTPCVSGPTPESNRINDLHEDRSGRIWAGTDGGLFLLSESHGQSRLEPVPLGLPAKPDRALQVWKVADDKNGSLWLGTSWGLVRRLRDGQTTHYQIQPARGADHVWTVLPDADSRIWIGHDTGLIGFRPDAPDSYHSDLADQPQEASVSRVRTVRLRMTAGAAVRFTGVDGVPGRAVLEILRSTAGQLWIGTTDGAARFDGRTFTAYTGGDWTPVASGIAEDRNGHIWIAGSGGALRLAGRGFVTYTSADGLPHGGIQAIFENRSGDLIVVGRGQRVHRFDRRRFTEIRRNLSGDRREFTGFAPPLQDSRGEWWVPGDAGLYRFRRVASQAQPFRVTPQAIYTSRDGLAGDDVFRLFEDSRGDIWIARRAPTRSVLTRWDRATGTFHRYTDRDGLPAFSRPIAFGEDREGHVWVGFWGGGLARYRHGRFTLFTAADGAPSDVIGPIHLDGAGRLWIGSAGSGAARIEDPGAARPRFVRYTTAQGLAADHIYSITDDRLGAIYFGLHSGVDRLDPRSGQVRHYALPAPLTGTEVDTAFRDRHGDLWFGSARGLARLVQAPDEPSAPPSMFIGALRISGSPYVVSELGDPTIAGIELDARQNNLQVDFFSITAESPVRYQYMLEGADREWSDPTNQRSVTFASLSPGNYRFLVRALGPDGVMSAPASVAFRIFPPVWQRWWFLTAAAALVAMAAYVLHRFRLGRLIELERMRMRIATDLHDDIGSSLTQIAILSEVAERRMKAPDPAVADPIGRVSRISRELVDSMSDIVWAINPRNDRLQDLASRMRRFAADVLAGRQIALSFRAPAAGQGAPIDAELRRQVFLIFKEAVHNAVRHSGCSQVDVAIGLEQRRLVLEVRDDGSGFDRWPSVHGNGLTSMQARAESLGGHAAILSSSGRGTTITVTIPLARRAGGARRAG